VSAVLEGGCHADHASCSDSTRVQTAATRITVRFACVGENTFSVDIESVAYCSYQFHSNVSFGFIATKCPTGIAAANNFTSGIFACQTQEKVSCSDVIIHCIMNTKIIVTNRIAIMCTAHNKCGYNPLLTQHMN